MKNPRLSAQKPRIFMLGFFTGKSEEKYMDRFPLIKVKGDAFERGRQYGEQTVDLIQFNLEGCFSRSL